MLEKKPSFQHVAVRCICTLLDAVPHFNFQESLLGVIVRNIGSSDDVIRFSYIYLPFIENLVFSQILILKMSTTGQETLLCYS